MVDLMIVPRAIWFTGRERQILVEIGLGRNNSEIAALLGLSDQYVKEVSWRLCRKVRVADHRKLIVWIKDHPEDVLRGNTRDLGLPEPKDLAA
jgi:DNA-binding NarL/FixJ family response regulator